MKNIVDYIQEYWKGNPGLPTLWTGFIPESAIAEHGFPMALVQIAGYGRDYTNSPMKLDMFRLRFIIFSEDAGQAYDLGQDMVQYLDQMDDEYIFNSQGKPEDFATPAEAGEKIVWRFSAVYELTTATKS